MTRVASVWVMRQAVFLTDRRSLGFSSDLCSRLGRLAAHPALLSAGLAPI